MQLQGGASTRKFGAATVAGLDSCQNENELGSHSSQKRLDT